MNDKTVLFCAPVVPEFDRESGSRRLYDLIVMMQDEGWQVALATRQSNPESRYLRLLEQQGVATYTGFTPNQAKSLCATSRIDLVIYMFWYIAEEYMPVVSETSPQTMAIVDSVDLHFLRKSRAAFCPSSNATTSYGLDAQYGDEMVRELNAYAASDGVLTVSQKEADLINDMVGKPGLALCIPDCEELSASTVPLAERRGILFLGNFRHPPNVGAVEYLCRDILPRLPIDLVEQHPVLVVGNGLNESICKLADEHPHIRMVGWVPSVVPYLCHARLSAIPLLYGAGTKRKLIQSLMVGTPCVTTSVGAEGLAVRRGREILVADDSAAFARAIEKLLTDNRMWRRISNAGASAIRQQHSRDLARQQLSQAVETIFNRPRRPIERIGHGIEHTYAELIDHIRRVVAEVIPPNSKIAVVSKGDDRLLDLGPRTAMHFPLDANGGYAGFYPGNSSDAIRHLAALQTQGLEYIVFPSPAFWWLDHYDAFRLHLQTHCRCICSDTHSKIYHISTEVLAPCGDTSVHLQQTS